MATLTLYKRYSGQTVENDVEGTRYLSEIFYPEVQLSDSDWYIESRRGDRLDLLADQFYNDVRLWYVIAQANHLGKGSLNVPPGIQLRIPMNIDQITQDFQNMQSI